MTKRLKRTPWMRRHALTLLKKAGVDEPEVAYRRLRARWVGETRLPAELKVHIVLGGGVCEWLGDLSQLQIIRCIERQRRFADDSPIEKVTASTLPLLATDFGAILNLCRIGFDVQARNLMRSFIERLDILICIRLDAEFAASYLAAESFEDSRRFFYKHISGGKLARKARKLFKENYPDADFIYDWLMGEWRAETSLMLSSAAHANHTIAMLSLFPNLGRGPSDALGLTGHPTNGSNITISKLLHACMPMHFLFSDYPYDEVSAYMRDAGINIDMIEYFRKFSAIILSFPLVNTWLRDWDAAVGVYENDHQ